MPPPPPTTNGGPSSRPPPPPPVPAAADEAHDNAGGGERLHGRGGRVLSPPCQGRGRRGQVRRGGALRGEQRATRRFFAFAAVPFLGGWPGPLFFVPGGTAASGGGGGFLARGASTVGDRGGSPRRKWPGGQGKIYDVGAAAAPRRPPAPRAGDVKPHRQRGLRHVRHHATALLFIGVGVAATATAVGAAALALCGACSARPPPSRHVDPPGPGDLISSAVMAASVTRSMGRHRRSASFI